MSYIFSRGELDCSGNAIAGISDNHVDMVCEFQRLLHRLEDVFFVRNIAINMLDV